MRPADIDGSGRPLLSASQEDYLDALAEELAEEVFEGESPVELAQLLVNARWALGEIASGRRLPTSDAFARLIREADRLNTNLEEAVERRVQSDEDATADAHGEALWEARRDAA